MSSHERKGWFNRNWKWLLPVGCSSIAVMIFVFVVAAVIFFVLEAVKSSDVYQQAIMKVKSSALVIRELGEPIEPGWFFAGSISVSNADLRIPISGPKKSGAIHAAATKNQGKWDFSTLEVVVEGESGRINVLTSSSDTNNEASNAWHQRAVNISPIIFVMVWIMLGIPGYFLFYFSKNVQFKRKYYPWYIILQGVLFIPFVLAIGFPLPVLFIFVPVMALVAFLHIKSTKFCDNCGRTIVAFRHSYGAHQRWAKSEYCKCGAKLLA